ncbi:cytochrome ubiquinol oxidase subunit I [Nocardiopsis suaedae]|uniref:Cytochrome ubiquinol oxidase subunit I n=1 Tax=Nocardiopsis suaedae TaxID=3018444 RepID=A0ABT4TNP1_9ACTN|nr:cytochrome ubiquinol oxidase subunit I [Nocardiopsis suaedae]MDA2806313.1 cytochrome ubiquinol oxidase subunit I [Nocardiopsis suaedae]
MLDDPLALARLQFAFTAATHYMFVALTLGLAPYILFNQLAAVRKRDEARMRAVRFWGGLYVVNYAMGVLSGLVMELQLALNWSGLSGMFGYAFGAPLAVETMGAFFVESTFLGLWIFGWDRMGRWAHWACFLVVTATAYASAYWVLVANGFLKWPAGFRIEDGTAVLDSPWALMGNPSALLAFAHVATSALLVGAAVIGAVSASHLRRGHDPDRMFHRGVRHAVAIMLVAVFPVVAFGGTQFAMIGQDPPTSGATYTAEEIAAIEAAASPAVEAVGRIGGDVVMMTSWLLITLVAGTGALVWLVRRLDRWRWFHWVLIALPALPYLASIGGWTFRETMRQPWVVRHHLTTADAMTDLSPAMAVASFAFFTAAFTALAAVTFWLLVRFARRGPEGGPLAPAPAGPDREGGEPVPARTL